MSEPVVYFLQRADGDIKIGWTRKLAFRTRTLSYKHGALKLLGVVKGGRLEEKALHERFAEFRRPSGKHIGSLRRPAYTEWFKPALPLMQFIDTEAEQPTPEMLAPERPPRMVRIAPDRQLETLSAVKNQVPNLLADRFGGKQNVNIQQVAHALQLTYSTVHRWATKDEITRIDAPVLEAWCKYLGVGVGDILEYVPDKE